MSGELKPVRVAKREPRRWLLAFTQNRSFELHVGGTVLAFGPHEAREVEAWIVEHPDFAQSPVRDLFVAREV